MSNSQFVLPNFKLRVAEFNTSKLTDLAASLAIAFSENGTTGITFTNINVTNLNAGNITATGMNISTLTGTNVNVTNFNFINETGTNATITNMTGTNLSTNFLRFVLATGQNLQLFVSGTNQFYSSPQFYSTSNSNNQNLVLGDNAQLTGSTSNIAIGWNSLGSLTGGNSTNVSIGQLSLNSLVTGSSNVAIGQFANTYVQGSSNVGIGFQSLSFGGSNINGNVAIGRQAGGSMSGINQANNNTLIGNQAGLNTVSTGTSLTIIGAFAGTTVGSGVSNSIAIGTQATVGQSNTAVFGNQNLTNILPGTGANVDLGISYQPFRSIYLTGSVNGSVNVANGTFTTTATTYSVLFTGANGTLILPAASTVPGITYKIFNNTAGNVTATGAFINGTGSTPFTLLANHLPTQLTSDGISSFWTI